MNRLQRSLVIVALIATTSIAALPLAPRSAVQADSGEGATAVLVDQQRRVTAGGQHTCAILDTGTVQCWGNNDHGQLGNGTKLATTRPNLVSGLSEVLSLAAGSSHTCALRHGGRVSCWGLNGSGQAGVEPVAVPPNIELLTAVAVAGIDDAVAIAAGAFHTCAIRSAGAVWCWGVNGNGELGDGSTGFSAAPVEAVGVTGAVAITAGDFHTCAVLGSGEARCWGHNEFGQLGDGSTDTSLVPVAVSGINTARSITAGSQHTCAVLADESIRCWGLNFYGQLGNGDHGVDNAGQPTEFPKHSTTPITPDGSLDATAISAGTYHTCALLDDGTGRCWGQNGRGQLGFKDPLDEHPEDSDEPVEVIGLAGATAITAGGFHTCAMVGPSLRCWGYNFFGQLGAYRDNNPVPVPVTALAGAESISVGDGHACAIVGGATDEAFCWGLNSDGQLGTAAGVVDSTVPVQVGTVTADQSISAGNRHTCVLPLGSGAPRCFGFNSNGQLGDATTNSSTAPVAVSGLTTASQLAAGGAFASVPNTDRGHTCARRSDATAVCWGRNLDGQLGNAANTDSSVPVVVSGLTGVTSVATGGFHSCAIVTGGEVRCWGSNSDGQLGHDATPDDDDDDPGPGSNVPVAVNGVSGATALALGAFHSCALIGDGTIRCWGRNASGQLGDDTNTGRDQAVTVAQIPGPGLPVVGPATGLAAGDFHTCALHNDGLVTCWGENGDGQLGNGGTSDATLRTPISNVLNPPGLPDVLVQQISAGRRNTCALLVETTVWCWGDNAHGQLGDGIGPMSFVPLTVVGLAATIATNSIPNAVADQLTTAPLTPATVDVLANDTDADADTLTVTSVSDPPQGTTTLTPPGSVEYTPDPAVCDPGNPDYAVDGFSYVVSDGTASVGAVVSVVVTCPNRPPVAGDDAASVAEDGSVDIDVLANDSDPDGSVLTVVAAGNGPANGSVTVFPTYVAYSPDPDYCGPDAFEYTVSDATDVDVATVSVTVTCGADPPIANPDAAVTAENQPVTVDVLANDGDVDPGSTLALVSAGHGSHGFTTLAGGGDVTYQPDLGFCGIDSFEYLVGDGGLVDTGVVTVTVECVASGLNAVDDSATVPEDGSVLVDVLDNDTDPDATPISIDSITQPEHGVTVIEAGQIRYTPAADFCGVDGFGYTAIDGDGETDGAVVVPVNVICNQDPPVAAPDVAGTLEDVPVSVPVLANDSDVDADQLAVVSVGDPPRGSAAIGPNGTVTYTPDLDQCGPDSFTYTIDDQHGGTAIGNIEVAVVCTNDAPTLSPLASVTVAWGTGVGVALVGADVDGDSLDYSVVSGPAGVAIAGSSLEWTPASNQIGSHSVTVRVSDGVASTDRTLVITVTRRSVTIDYDGAVAGQYSDQATASATIRDAATNAPLPGLTANLAIGAQAATAVTGAGGQAVAAIVVTAAAGASTATASFAGTALYAGAGDTTPFNVARETIDTQLTGNFMTTTAGSSASVALTARVTEESDGRPGSIGGVSVAFRTPAGVTLCTASVTVVSSGIGTASCSVTLGVGAHAVIAAPTATSYAGPVDVGAVVVASTAAGGGAGGGEAGGAAFGLHAQPGAKKAPATGSVVHVWIDAGDAVVVSSATISSFTRSCSGGGATKTCTVTVNTGSGAVVRRVALATGLVSNAGTATASLTGVDKPGSTPDTYAATISGSVSHAVSSTALTAGSIRVV